jgi:glycerol-3-phosphate cytidylyltransferase
MIIGFTCGSFDLLHSGHVLMLKECRQNCDWLVVGLQTDPTIDRPSKNKPVQSIEERRIQLDGCKYVDAVIEYTTERELFDILLILQDKLLSRKQRLIRFIGSDWKGKDYTGHELPIEVFFNSRTHSFSSTNLRKRIYNEEKNRLHSETTL